MKPINWSPKLREAFDNIGSAIVIVIVFVIPTLSLARIIWVLAQHLHITWK